MSFSLGARKIQKTNYTFLLPLPPVWIKNTNLGKGSSVDIELMEDGSLKITPS